jgi:hypothetical protein
LYALVGEVVPDYRGIFLRGYGIQISDHYGIVTHKSGALGILQGDAIRNIEGSFVADIQSWRLHTDKGYGAFLDVGPIGHGDDGGDSDQKDEVRNFSFDASRVVPTDSENRPVNKAVRYLIGRKIKSLE